MYFGVMVPYLLLYNIKGPQMTIKRLSLATTYATIVMPDFWYEERLGCSNRRSFPLYHRCCLGGRVYFFIPHEYPQYVYELFSDQHFLNNIRAYNQMFAMMSLGADIDESVNTGRGPYVFKVSARYTIG